MGMACLDPKWAGGRPRGITTDDEPFIVETTKARSKKLGRPFTHWSVRKLAQYLTTNTVHRVTVGRERLREILSEHGVTFQKAKTWNESTDPTRTPSWTASTR